MARDEAILEAVARDEQPPTLRLYAWRVPTLSLGYAQPSADADLSRLRERGWGLVRRLSGGRAILHADEITYSVTLPESHPLAQGGVIESYRRLSAALIAALRLLAPAMPIEADQRHERAAAPNAICFEVPSDYEITARGKKLIGSAQMRKYGGVLQHGALPLGGDVATSVRRSPSAMKMPVSAPNSACASAPSPSARRWARPSRGKQPPRRSARAFGAPLSYLGNPPRASLKQRRHMTWRSAATPPTRGRSRARRLR